MDNHPIPQDVTGFQFKLIGTMTVKQFGYVASGVVAAVILYYLPINSAFGVLLKVILIPIFGASGAIISFVPIDGRPIDVMATNFVKAVISPNQYIYRRQGRQLSFTKISAPKAPTAKKSQQEVKTAIPSSIRHTDSEEKEEKLRALLFNSRGVGKNDIDKREAAFLNTLTLPTTPVAQATVPTPAPQMQTPVIAKPQIQPFIQAPAPRIAPLPPIKPLIQQPAPMPIVKPPADMTPKPAPIDMPKKELAPSQTVVTQPSNPIATTVNHPEATVLSQQIQDIHSKKEQLERELSQLKQQLATQKGVPAASTPTTAPGQPLQDPQHVRVIPQDVTKKAGLPHVSDSPNVVVGIVKDPRGNVLPHILVEVKDKDGNPVRAFKTNQLGQFASATPLSTGTYTIELEDPKKQQRFDVIQIVANNQVLLPIEIISHDAREDLRKQLFAN
ncbi:MAG TPA: PrgI family protein [Candidatus Saccharimonadales bacterium]|nr:PrgI family protein [Candidatus Saccharimonadales bacterium]